MGRVHPAWLAFGGSLLLLGVCGFLLWWGSLPPGPSDALTVYAAAGLRVPLDLVVQDYERETGQQVVPQYGGSADVLTKVQIGRQSSQPADLFIPADEVYIDLARQKDLIDDTIPVARMSAVVVVRPGCPKTIRTWDDLVGEGVKVVLAEKSAAIGKLTADRLIKTGRWDALRKRTTVTVGTVNEVASTVRLGAADAGIVWDAVAHQFPQLTVVRLPELDGVLARVQAAVVKDSRHPRDALRFARFLAAGDRGSVRFRESGFTPVEGTDAFGGVRPRILLFAGSMLRPAIERTVKEFSDREGVSIETVYNGCGVLVGQMKTGARPDVYFSCDPQFMHKVRDLFDPPQVISSNQLVIAVPRGNPHDLRTLKDLGNPGLKVGVGHEQQCALGAITKETFLQAGVYRAVRRNIVVETPAGDLLINQLRARSLDAVVAYRSNTEPYQDLDAIPVTGIPCAAPRQPIAVSRTTAHPQLVKRLLDAIRSAESKERFTKLGFGWSPASSPTEAVSRP